MTYYRLSPHHPNTEYRRGGYVWNKTESVNLRGKKLTDEIKNDPWLIETDKDGAMVQRINTDSDPDKENVAVTETVEEDDEENEDEPEGQTVQSGDRVTPIQENPINTMQGVGGDNSAPDSDNNPNDNN